MTEKWLSEPVVKEWFSIITNKRTQENYRSEFPLFLDYVRANTPYQTATEILASRVKQDKSDSMAEKRYWEDTVKRYMHYLEKKGYRTNTIRSYLRTVLSFFSHAHYDLKYARKELLGAVEPNEKDKVSKEWIASNEDVRVLYRMSQSSRDRGILLTLYQSGFSPIDVCALNIEHFNFYDEKGDWKIPSTDDAYIDKLREKTNVHQQTCISREAIEEIRIMLQSRGYPKKGPLFVSVHNQRLAPRDINSIMKSIVVRAFNGKAEQWQTKNLRDSYKNGLIRAKLSQEIIDCMFGHKREGAKDSYKLTEETVRTMYAEAFKFLTVNGYGSEGRKIEELQAEVQKNNETVLNTIRELQGKVNDLKNKYIGEKVTLDALLVRLRNKGINITREDLEKLAEEENSSPEE